MSKSTPLLAGILIVGGLGAAAYVYTGKSTDKRVGVDEADEKNAMSMADDSDAPDVIGIELGHVASDALFVAVVNDPSVPLRNLGILSNDNAINPKIRERLGPEIQEIEDALQFKIDDTTAYKDFLPSAPYVFSLYGESPEALTGVFELSYALPNSAMTAINKKLAADAVVPTKEKIGPYTAYFYQDDAYGALVMKNRLIFSFASGSNSKDVRSRLKAIGEGTLTPILTGPHQSRLEKTLAQPFNAMLYVSGKNAIWDLWIEDAYKELPAIYDKAFFKSLMTFDAMVYAGFITKDTIEFQASSFGQDHDLLPLQSFVQANGQDAFIERSGFAPMAALKLAVPLESALDIFDSSTQKEWRTAFLDVKAQTQIDIESDIMNNVGSPVSLALGHWNSEKQTGNVAMWAPLKDAAAMDLVLSKLTALAEQEQMPFAKENGFYMLPNELSEPLTIGFGIKHNHLIVGIGDDIFNDISKGGHVPNAVSRVLQDSTQTALAMDLTQLDPLVDAAGVAVNMAQQNPMLTEPEKNAMNLALDFAKDIASEQQFFGLNARFDKADKSLHLRGKYQVNSSFRKIFNEKLLPFVASVAEESR